MYLERIKRTIVNGWRLTASAVKLLNQAKSIYVLSVIKGAVVITLIGLYVYFGLHMYIRQEGPDAYSTGINPDVFSILLLPVAVLAVNLVTAYFQSAKTYFILKSFDGQKVQWRDIFRQPFFAKVKKLTIFSTGLGGTLGWLGSLIPVVGTAAGTVGAYAWRFANAFTAPILIESDTKKPLKEAVRESAALTGKAWPQLAAIELSVWVIGLLTMIGVYVASIPFAILHANVYGMTPRTGSLQFLALFLEVFLVFELFSAILHIASTGLYRHIKTGETPDVFDKTIVKTMMSPAKAQKIFK